MKFLAALFALMAVASVTAAPAHAPLNGAGAKAVAVGKAAKAGKGSKASASSASASNSAASSADNSTASSVDGSASSANATATDNSGSNAATGTSSAASATRTRACDQGDQSLAAGLQASVVIGIGQQASIVTLQNSTAAADFATAQTRLQQFVDTQALQLQMAQGIADDGSFAQTQLKLLAASQTAQATLVKSLVGGDVTSSAATLTQLAGSFLDSTNNAQDGAEQALIDCFLPLNAVSG